MATKRTGKRGAGEGTFRKREDGRWEARFRYTDAATGEERRGSTYGKTRAEAAAKMKEKVERAEGGAPVADSRATFAAYLETWIAGALAVSDRKESTKVLYAGLGRKHLGASDFGKITLDKLRPVDVEKLILSMREKDLSASTIRQTYTILRAALDTAVRDHLVARNVAAIIKRPGVRREEARALSAAEFARLRDALAKTRLQGLVTLMALTGLRRGEALALTWSDIDEANGIAHVRRTLSRIKGELVTTTPKTDKSRRAVPLSADALAVLRSQRTLHREDAARLGSDRVERGLVFATELGGHIDPRNALRAVLVGAKRAELPGVGLHTLRHTAASLMLQAGVPLKVVSEILGHSSISVTGDIYGHVAPEVAQDAAAILARALTPKLTPTGSDKHLKTVSDDLGQTGTEEAA